MAPMIQKTLQLTHPPHVVGVLSLTSLCECTSSGLLITWMRIFGRLIPSNQKIDHAFLDHASLLVLVLAEFTITDTQHITSHYRPHTHTHTHTHCKTVSTSTAQQTKPIPYVTILSSFIHIANYEHLPPQSTTTKKSNGAVSNDSCPILTLLKRRTRGWWWCQFS